jgi:membrane-associated PAP2 superfamily phosphatase
MSQIEKTKQIAFDFAKPLIILAFLTTIIRLANLDISIQSLFFEKGQGWVYGNMWLWKFLYKYGVFPGFALSIIGLSTLLLAAFFPRSILANYKKKALFLILLLALGPGLIVNVTFKENWGRPRPRETIVFEGNNKFLEVWQLGQDKDFHSFPSGHASMGFYLLAPYFLLRRRSSSSKKPILVLTGGIGYGLLMGLARMAQGGHFFSDVICSAGFVYLSGLALFYIMKFDQDR